MSNLTTWNHAVGPGWQEKLVNPFLEVADRTPEIMIGQIKEKFGTLCLYISGPEWAQHLAEALEDASRRYCEDCGRVDGWWQSGDDEAAKVTTAPVAGWSITLCQTCRAEAEAEREKRSRSLADQAHPSEG